MGCPQEALNFSFCFAFGLLLEELRGFSGLGTQASVLATLRESYEMAGIKPGLFPCKANALSTVLPPQPQYLTPEPYL